MSNMVGLLVGETVNDEVRRSELIAIVPRNQLGMYLSAAEIRLIPSGIPDILPIFTNHSGETFVFPLPLKGLFPNVRRQHRRGDRRDRAPRAKKNSTVTLATLEALRRTVRQLCSNWAQRLRVTADLFVQAEPPADPAVCALCGGRTGVEKTRVRGGVTLAHGRVRIGLTVRVCRAGCRANATRSSPDLSALFPARATFGYDVIVRVGLERFVQYRQRKEIRAVLAAEGVEVSEAQVSLLSRRFLDFLEALHIARAPELRAALAADGGWPMHIDATGEDGRGTLLVVYAGWRGWALGAWKVPTERADIIAPRLQQMADRFGPPCAIMRDLGRAVSEAAAMFVAERKPTLPILACHMHFLRDVGKDLMRKMHDELRGRFRHFKVQPHLRALARGLGRHLGPALPKAREALERWLGQSGSGHRLPGGKQGLAVVRALAQWVLDFPSDGLDQGFPFDVPMLDLYGRSREVLSALDAFLRTAPSDAKVQSAAERLHSILRPIDCEVPFDQIARVLRTRRALFHELRDALRLGPKPNQLSHPRRRNEH